MKHIQNITTLLLAMTLALLLSACNTKTSQDENNTTGSSSPTTQTTEDTSATGSGAVTGGTTQNGGTTATNNSGATTSSGGSSNATGSNNNATNGNTNTVGGSNNSTTGGDGHTGTGTESNSTQTDANTTTGGEETNTTTDDNNSTDTNTTTTPTVTLKSLNLTANKTSLNKDENTTVKVMATYSDNSTKEVTDKVKWVVVPNDAIQVSNITLTALQDKATTVKAKLKGKSSNAINLNITWVVNGHTLPPEPDKALNDSTLLGIDVNDNDVRDDVERWIYEEYKDKHPIYIDIAMQAGRAYKLVLETPEKAKEIRERVNAPYFCGSYYMDYVKFFHKPVLVHERIDVPVKSKYFNTKDRSNVYRQYDHLLSGDSYPLPKIRKMKDQCDFNTSKYDKE